MGVIYGFNPSPGTADAQRSGSGPGVDADAATVFLQTQASWLCRALERAADPTTVGIVLGSHDASHESWLALIAAVERRDRDLGERLASLYGYHGRVVGSLERGLDVRLDPDVSTQVRRLLASRLLSLTEEAVVALHGLRSATTSVGA